MKLGVTFEDGELIVDGLRFEELALDGWPLERLETLTASIRSLQANAWRRTRTGNPTDHLFISSQEYQTRRMWHEDSVVHYAPRQGQDEFGNPVTESGYIVVPRSLSEDEYVLRDAVLRVYGAPAYTAKLTEQGEAYSATVLEEHPECAVDVTADLTHWVFTDPDGSIVGWMSSTRNGDT